MKICEVILSLLIVASLVSGVGCTASDVQTPAPIPDAGSVDNASEPDFGGGNPVVTSVVIEPLDTTIGVGERITYVATPFDADGVVIESGQGSPQWESSDPAVAPISSGGTVTGATPGTTTISVTFQDVTESVELTVSEARVEMVEVLPPRVVFSIGDDFDFLAVARGADGDRIDMAFDVTWEVRETSIATVDGSIVTAVAAGTTELVATIDGVSGTAELVVEDAVLEGLQIDQIDQSVVPGDSVELTVSFTWQDTEPANLPTVAWSSNDAVVTVDAAGVVTAVAPGSATVTATVGDKTDSVRIDVAGDFEQVAVGAAHTCGSIGGAVYCWGSNDDGQLGHAQPGFARVPGIPLAQDLAAGRAHTCIRSIAGDVFCWGANDLGQQGLGTTTPGPGKTAVSLPMAQLAGGRLYASRDATCAGEYCWGDLVSQTTSTPTVVGGSLYVGEGHRCEISGANTVCSGDNDQGQIGINSNAPTGSGSPVGGFDFSSLSLGTDFTCGLVIAGGMACWGNGTLGQLGDGSFADAIVPILTPLAAQPTELATGDAHVCARTPAGALYCWGSNAMGQVGDGTTTNAGDPVDVTGGRVYTSIRAEGARTCGVASGEVWCWGGGQASPVAYSPMW